MSPVNLCHLIFVYFKIKYIEVENYTTFEKHIYLIQDQFSASIPSKFPLNFLTLHPLHQSIQHERIYVSMT